MNDDKYGIELELIVSTFKKQIQQVKDSIDGIKDVNVGITTNTAQIEYLKAQIRELTAQLSANSKQPFWNNTETLRAQARLEKLNEQLRKLQENEEDVGNTGITAFAKMKTGIGKVTSNIKRFALGLLSVRSIYSILSRASSAYMAQDTALSNKLTAVWTGLGALLAPIIEKIVNVLIKGVKYINIFIKALTGVDLLAKATSKSLNKTASGAKAVSKALAGFDELTNLDTGATGGATGIDTSWADALSNVDINMEWAEKIETFGNWIRDHKDEIIAFFITLGTVIGLIKVAEFINNFAKVVSLVTSLTPLLTILGGIVMLFGGIILALNSIVDYLENPTWENFGKILAGIALIVAGVGVLFGAIPALIVAIIGAVVALGLAVYKNWDAIKEVLSKVAAWINEKIIQPVGKFFSGLWEGLKNGISSAIQFVKDKFNQMKTFLSNVISNIVDLFRNIGTKVGDGISSAFKSVINAVLSKIQNILNTPINAINKMLDKVNTLPGVNLTKLNTFSFPKLNVGTNYVPEDQLAYIHKGEAVVPKKFNSDEYFGRGNEETNSLLETLIEKVEQIEINPYTTIKEVGEASVNYINGKKRQTGRSVLA